MAERNVLADGLKRCNSGARRLWRNLVGVFWIGRGKPIVARTRMPVVLNPGDVVLRKAHRVTAGLPVGSGDTIGLRQIVVTPEMVGRTVAVFVSAEAKSDTGRGRVREEQGRWRDFINRMGGIAFVFESAEELESKLNAPFVGVKEDGDGI